MDSHTPTVTPPLTAQQENIGKGLLWAALAIPVSAIAWVLVWQLGFIASVVSFGMAWLMGWLYTRGAGRAPSRRAAVPLLVLVVVGVAVSFLAGLASDAASVYAETTQTDAMQAITSGDFWSFYFDNLGHADLWSGYAGDLTVSILFAAAGTFSFVRTLFVKQEGAKV